jgi:pyruvate dehydrogenase E2 component (dihydrolipoamide acetyltransferase)
MGDFRMPSLGADMEEGTLLEWLVKPGDAVHRGDIVAVVDTSKSAVEVECFDDGVIDALLVAPGQVVPVGAVLARLEGSAAGPTSTGLPGVSPVAAAPAPVQTPEQVLSQTPQLSPPLRTPIAPSPLVRHRAHELGIDLAALHGTGAGGVVHRRDIEELAHQAPPRPRVSPLARRLAASVGIDLTTVSGTGAGGAVRADDIRRATAATATGQATERTTSGLDADQRATAMRNSIAALMSRSKREIPHYYLSTTVDLQRISEWMRERNRELPVGERLVPSAALLSAAARAAREVPELNGHWVDGGFRPARDVDLGLILSLRSGGLLVPVLAAADTLDISQVMALMRDLTRRARTGRLRGSELSQPSISVSNLGDQGVESVLGVIYPPQVALIGFGAVTPRPWAVDGLLGVRPLVTVTLAADHRATDAAIGARLLKIIDRILQTPEEP